MPWIAKNAFSDVLNEKKKKRERRPRWFFKDIELTPDEELLLSKISKTLFLLFTGMLLCTIIMFWHLLLFDISGECDVDDPSKDCFEIATGGSPKQDPVNCSSAAIQDGTTRVQCYKIVFNFGVARGASYGIFKTSLLAINLASSVLLMIKRPKLLRAIKVIAALLVVLASAIVVILVATPVGVAFLSNHFAVLLQALIVVLVLVNFLYGIPWSELRLIANDTNDATNDNQNDTALENPVAPTDDS